MGFLADTLSELQKLQTRAFDGPSTITFQRHQLERYDPELKRLAEAWEQAQADTEAERSIFADKFIEAGRLVKVLREAGDGAEEASDALPDLLRKLDLLADRAARKARKEQAPATAYVHRRTAVIKEQGDPVERLRADLLVLYVEEHRKAQEAVQALTDAAHAAQSIGRQVVQLCPEPILQASYTNVVSSVPSSMLGRLSTAVAHLGTLPRLIDEPGSRLLANHNAILDPTGKTAVPL